MTGKMTGRLERPAIAGEMTGKTRGGGAVALRPVGVGEASCAPPIGSTNGCASCAGDAL